MKLFASLLAIAATVAASAANPIPVDPAVRTGTLPNGLTYYIRHNATPAGQADFFIAQRVGSVNELEGQEGLAHFLEHMCFNGTEHFPGNSLISYLESLGVKFGRNLNAYTSTDETVYNICEVPTARQSALDSCVMILGDWSGRLPRVAYTHASCTRNLSGRHIRSPHAYRTGRGNRRFRSRYSAGILS